MATHVVPASIQIEAEKLREPGAEMGMAVGVDRECADRGDPLTYDALDRGTDLAAHQWQGLVVEDPPLIEHGLVHPHAIDAALRVDARIVEMFARIEAHQIGRRLESAAPVLDDVMAAGEVQQRLIGLAQRRLRLEQAQIPPDGPFVDPADHGCHAA